MHGRKILDAYRKELHMTEKVRRPSSVSGNLLISLTANVMYLCMVSSVLGGPESALSLVLPKPATWRFGGT